MTPVSRSQKAVRIYAADYELLLWRQANAVLNGQDKPSFAELIHQAVALLAQNGTPRPSGPRSASRDERPAQQPKDDT